MAFTEWVVKTNIDKHAYHEKTLFYAYQYVFCIF